jgi:hypothetical protein
MHRSRRNTSAWMLVRRLASASSASSQASKIRSIYQKHGNHSLSSYLIQQDGISCKSNILSAFNWQSIRKLLAKTRVQIFSYFLPSGYPNSVDRNYSQFVIGNMIATTSSTVGGVLSMQAMLYAVGLGAGAIPAAAALNWVIKDGVGQFGGVIFASFIGNRFDSDPKRWRLLSAISMDAASLLEMLTPLAPSYFLVLASVANIGKNIAFLSASASRAALHKSFAIYENLADVTVKSGSQSVLSSMVGTGLGVFLSAYVGTDYTACLAAFTCCSAISITASIYSLRNATIKSISINRMEYLLSNYLRDTNLGKLMECQHDDIPNFVGEMNEFLSPKQLSKPNELRATEDSMFRQHIDVPLKFSRLYIGASIDSVIGDIREYEV